MSNFLRRVVSNVASAQAYPEPRLHPILGSVFAPHIPVAPFGAQSPAASETVAGPYQGASPSNQPARNNPPLITPSPIEAALPFHRNASSPFAQHQYLPLLPIGQIGEAPSHLSPTDADRSAHRGPDAGAPRRQADAVTASNPGPSGNSAHPPVPGKTIPTQPLPNHPPLVRLAPIRPEPSIQQRQTARWEPDEIHIHIGRIEVAAIAAPAPRPTSAPPRKTLNLDEYLRRGSGIDGNRR
jgi:hypothetical protein